MPSQQDLELARLLIENGLVSQSQVQEALAFMSKLASAGSVASLREILVRKGYLSASLDLEVVLGDVPAAAGSGEMISADELEAGMDEDTPAVPLPSPEASGEGQDVVAIGDDDVVVLDEGDEVDGSDVESMSSRDFIEITGGRPSPPPLEEAAMDTSDVEGASSGEFTPEQAGAGAEPAAEPEPSPEVEAPSAPDKGLFSGSDDVLDLSALSELSDRLERGETVEPGSALDEFAVTAEAPQAGGEAFGDDPLAAFQEAISSSSIMPAVSEGEGEAAAEEPQAEVRQVGRYKVGAAVRQGLFGPICEAVDTATDNPVYIETFAPTEMGWTGCMMETLLAEALTAGAINHRNLLKILDAAGHGRDGYIVTEPFKGTPLDEKVEVHGALPADKMVALLYKCCSALAAAERKNIVHYDLRPSCILISEDWNVKIANLGLCQFKRLDGPMLGGAREELRRALLMAPEVCEGAAPTVRTSVYALGTTCYYAATGRYPIVGESPLATALKHISGDFVPPDRRNPSMPEELGRILRKMMARDPERRYSGFRQVIDDVELLQAQRNLAHARLSEFQEMELESSELQPVFCIIKGRSRNVVFTLGRDDEMTIGRDSSRSKLPILDGMVSRLHCSIKHAGDKFTVQDLGSSNGTTLNGQTIDMVRTLHPGDRVKLGSTEILFGYAPTDPDTYHMATLAVQKNIVTLSQAEEAILHCGNAMQRMEPCTVTQLLQISGRADDEALVDLFSGMDEQILVHDMILREMRQQQASLLQAEVTDAVLPQETRIMRSLLDEFHFCESCGAPILAEHLDMGIAERVSGLPFCQACAIESTFLGQRLGDVTLGQIVGAGRLGFVYRGSTGAESGASTLAAKVFHHSLLENSDFTEALKRSIDEAAKFEHPNVIRVHGLHEVGNTLALTMDYGGRFSLNIRLHSGIGEMSRSLQPLTVPDALYIGYNVAQALSYAHSEGTVHGELWPGKIFVTPRGRVGVVGFGIRAEDLFANTPQQKDVRFRGLLAPFEAPEKRKSKQLDPSMDQFSLGAVLYTMLLGKLCNPQTASHDVINEGVVLPKDITQMLARMLDPDASKRFPSIGDYLSALQALMPQ